MERKSLFFIGLLVAVFMISGAAYADLAADKALRAEMAAKSANAQSLKIQRSMIPATAKELALAMDIPEEDIAMASIWDSDARAVGIYDTNLGNQMPQKGGTFAILSTGLAESADDPNTMGSLSFTLDGLNNVQDYYGYPAENDLVQLTLVLKVPEGATCFGFDFVYYSEEFPEWVNSSFNDTFLAELGSSTFVINQDNSVTAPNNIAFDTAGNLISVNTVFGVTANTSTTYDGGTPLLKAVSPIPAGIGTVTIVFTIQDLGDSIYDSAVFIDNFYWSTDATCNAGALIDTDGDGLLDIWEKDGLDINDDGVVDVDLPAMGANPNHKDIFVEVDYMVKTVCDAAGCSLHSHQPKKEAIQKVIDAFMDAPLDNPDGTTGIVLHVDAGPNLIMNPVTGQTWGDLSCGNALYHDDYLGTGGPGNYNWGEFEGIKSVHFSAVRKNIFRYCVFGNELSEELKGVSGASRGVPSSGFVVTLGSWADGFGTVSQQAGAFMHGLGNNLGLGGDLKNEFNPYYLSVMNPLFQTRGLRMNGVDGKFDYSRFDIPAIDEQLLSELAMNLIPSEYGTISFVNSVMTFIDSINAPVDWNNNGTAGDIDVQADINNDGILTIIPAVVNEWKKLIFKGGEIGSLGIMYDPLIETPATDINTGDDANIPTPYAVGVSGFDSVTLQPGSSGMYKLTLKNTGDNADTYKIEALTDLGWLDISALPASVTIDPGQSMSFDIPASVPAATALGTIDSLTITVTSQGNANVSDVLFIQIKIVAPGDANGDGSINIVVDNSTLEDFIMEDGAVLGNGDCNGDGVINALDIICNLIK